MRDTPACAAPQPMNDVWWADVAPPDTSTTNKMADFDGDDDVLQVHLPVWCATPYTLHPTPYTLHPTPYTLHPTPYTLHTNNTCRCFRRMTPCTMTLKPLSLNPKL